MVPVIFGRGGQDSRVSFPRVNVVSVAILLASLGLGFLGMNAFGSPVPLIVMAIAGAVLMQAPRVAEQWERAVVLRLGRFVGLHGPGLRAWLDAALANAAAGSEMPFATVDVPSGRPIGSTRFMSIVPEHRRLEIGWTWVAPAWQRQGANQEAKYLQLRHAFEDLGANRVEFKTDSRNERANPALLAIGATFEGTFRNHMVMPDGPLRHSNYYSVIAEEWPDRKAKLEARIAAIRGSRR
jgi:RimJ/RimL family protein N-acetyltransferase